MTKSWSPVSGLVVSSRFHAMSTSTVRYTAADHDIMTSSTCTAGVVLQYSPCSSCLTAVFAPRAKQSQTKQDQQSFSWTSQLLFQLRLGSFWLSSQNLGARTFLPLCFNSLQKRIQHGALVFQSISDSPLSSWWAPEFTMNTLLVVQFM